jgi:dTMP kinase
MTMGHGCFVALEGGEGSGKSTQAALLAGRLGAVLTREPGGTAIGGRLRALLLDGDAGEVDARTEALLMTADRAQHIVEVVGPALRRGQHVVSDRSAMSFLAYQGYGRGLPIAELRAMTEWATRGVWPDLVLLIDVPPTVARARAALAGAPPDRLEAEGGGFHDRVRGGFLTLAREDPQRWVVVDGTGSPDEVAERVTGAVCAYLGPG